jgi:hypothetical protein
MTMTEHASGIDLVTFYEDRLRTMAARRLQAARELNYCDSQYHLILRSLRSAKAASTARARRRQAA